MKGMAKRRIEKIVNDESYKNKKCNKISIKSGIDREKVFFLIEITPCKAKTTECKRLQVTSATGTC